MILKIQSAICNGIFIWQITDMAGSHRIKIIDDLHNYYEFDLLFDFQISILFFLFFLLIEKILN